MTTRRNDDVSNGPGEVLTTLKQFLRARDPFLETVKKKRSKSRQGRNGKKDGSVEEEEESEYEEESEECKLLPGLCQLLDRLLKFTFVFPIISETQFGSDCRT